MYSNPTEKPKPTGRITQAHLQKLYREKEKITMVACYDATAAEIGRAHV